MGSSPSKNDTLPEVTHPSSKLSSKSDKSRIQGTAGDTSSGHHHTGGRFLEVQLQEASSPRQVDNTSSVSHQGNRPTVQQEKLLRQVDQVTSGQDIDFHSVINQNFNKQDKMAYEAPQYSPDVDLVMESFYHNSGDVFSCIFQGGQRFYLNYKTQDLHPFPSKWYDEGIIVTEDVIKSEQLPSQKSKAVENKAQQCKVHDSRSASNTNPKKNDDREGSIMHPTAGKIETYIYEEKHNVHYYFDEVIGQYVKMPVAWELRSELIQRLMNPIKEALPEWTDEQDMLAALRASNYDPHDCITTYITVNERGHIALPRCKSDVAETFKSEEKIAELEEYTKKLKRQNDNLKNDLIEERDERKSSEALLDELKEKVNIIEVELATSRASLEALQNQRPKTARPRTAKTKVIVKATVNPEDIEEVQETVKLLHKSYLQLKADVKKKFHELQDIIKQCMVGVLKIKMVESNQSQRLEELSELYRKEALQRKLLYNKLQEMRGNIRVFCRCRHDDRVKCALQFPSELEVLAPSGKKMVFDKVFDQSASQEQIFKEARDIILSCVDGYNVCILAYGQTGSGKTYTMMGPSDDPGVNVRSIKELLSICNDQENIDYTLMASMVEIYNETIIDLLSSNCNSLELRTQGNKVTIQGLVEMKVEDEDDINGIMKLGAQNRTTASTKMNSASSRSHLVFMVTVAGINRTSKVTSKGVLTLCDLAGSERVGKTEAKGQRLVEAAAINKSLTALGQVFTSLRMGQLHVPYRNSKLTHLLQPCLSGDAKACLFVMVSPDSSNITETMSTLTFGSNARQVQLGEAKRNTGKKG